MLGSKKLNWKERTVLLKDWERIIENMRENSPPTPRVSSSTTESHCSITKFLQYSMASL